MSDSTIVSALVTNKVTKAAMDYVNKFPIDNLQKFTQDFNNRLSTDSDQKFNESVYDYIRNNQVLSDLIGISNVPNHKGRFEIFVIRKEDAPLDLVAAKRYIMLHQRAKDKNLDFNLELKDIKRLLKIKRCTYSGIELTDFDPSMSTYRTMDRIDSNKGYTKDNVFVCCNFVNQFKSSIIENTLSNQYLGMDVLKKVVNNLSKKGL